MPKKPHEDARFTDLVCGLSSRLAVAPYERIPDEVGAALEAIREFFGIEQCSLFRFVVESRAVVLVQRAVVEGVPPIPAEVDYGRAFPLTYRTVVEELRPYILDPSTTCRRAKPSSATARSRWAWAPSWRCPS
ncbi:MAG: hypothetical protein IPJ28_18170 [Betaproteobacteria bacterium]|nr:hypothetical protein [Betaproteobacteria bacterium]